MDYLRTLKAIQRADEPEVGERAVDLALLSQRDYDVPATFVLTNAAFELFIGHNLLQQPIGEALLHDPETGYDAIRELILAGKFPKEMVREIVEAYESLGIDPEAGLKDIAASPDAPFVDLVLSPNHSVPEGNNEGIILNVRGLEELLLAIKECWACLFTPTMQRHRKAAGITNRNLDAGIILQAMPKANITAEAWSATAGNVKELTVKAYYGALDLGIGIEKDESRFTREYLKPVFQRIARQTIQLTRDEDDRLSKLPIGKRGEEQTLNDRMMIEVARLAKKASGILERHLKLFFAVKEERISLLICNRLLLTKGSVLLDGYEAEERIEETPETAKENNVLAEETGPEPAEHNLGREIIVEEERAGERREEARQDEDDEEPVLEEPTRVEEPPRTEIEKEESILSVDDETGKEKVLEMHAETMETGAATQEEDSIFSAVTEVDEEPATETQEDKRTEPNRTRSADEGDAKSVPTLAERYTEVVEALRTRYEARFRNIPPNGVRAVFSELKEELIIPQEEEIERLITLMEEGREPMPDEEEPFLSAISEFLEGFR